jgi:hypothetical protein
LKETVDLIITLCITINDYHDVLLLPQPAAILHNDLFYIAFNLHSLTHELSSSLLDNKIKFLQVSAKSILSNAVHNLLDKLKPQSFAKDLLTTKHEDLMMFLNQSIHKMTSVSKLLKPVLSAFIWSNTISFICAKFLYFFIDIMSDIDDIEANLCWDIYLLLFGKQNGGKVDFCSDFGEFEGYSMAQRTLNIIPPNLVSPYLSKAYQKFEAQMFVLDATLVEIKERIRNGWFRRCGLEKKDLNILIKKVFSDTVVRNEILDMNWG